MIPPNENAPGLADPKGAETANQTKLVTKCSIRAAQCSTILRVLRESSQTTFQIRAKYDIPHVGGRICDLRNAGHEIITTRCWDSMPGGELHFVALYTLLPQRQKELLL